MVMVMRGGRKKRLPDLGLHPMFILRLNYLSLFALSQNMFMKVMANDRCDFTKANFPRKQESLEYGQESVQNIWDLSNHSGLFVILNRNLCFETIQMYLCYIQKVMLT